MGSDYGLIDRGELSDNDRSVMSAGINIYWYKTQVLFLGASVGSFAGAFGTHVDMFAGMPGFALDYSIMPVAAAVVGGMGTFAGPMIGRIYPGALVRVASCPWCPQDRLLRPFPGHFCGGFARRDLPLYPEKVSAVGKMGGRGMNDQSPLLRSPDLTKSFGGVAARIRCSFELKEGNFWESSAPTARGRPPW